MTTALENAPSASTVPDDASALHERCRARRVNGRQCGITAVCRALLTCPGCGLNGAIPLCAHDRRRAAALGPACLACRLGGTSALVTLVAVEPL